MCTDDDNVVYIPVTLTEKEMRIAKGIVARKKLWENLRLIFNWPYKE